jgi:hypothetical protein
MPMNKVKSMKVGKTLKNLDEIKLIQRRFELITVARYRDKNKMIKASEEIDKIRAKVKSGGKSTTEILREWRDRRYGLSSS